MPDGTSIVLGRQPAPTRAALPELEDEVDNHLPHEKLRNRHDRLFAWPFVNPTMPRQGGGVLGSTNSSRRPTNPRCTTRRKTGAVGAPRPMKMGSIASPWRAMTSRAAAHNCWQGRDGAKQGTALVVWQARTKRSYDVS